MNGTRGLNIAPATVLLVVLTATAASAQGARRGSDAGPPEAGLITLPTPTLQPERTGTVRHLSVNEAVALALEHNLGIRAERFNPQIQDLVIADARSVWLPNLSATFVRNNQTVPASSFLSGGETEIVDKLFDNSLMATQQLPLGGGNYSVEWGGARISTTNFFTSFNPILRPDMRLSYTQPLLRNFKIDTGRQQLRLAAKNREISDVRLRQTIVATERNVRNAYWDLVFGASSLKVQQQSLKLAKESLRNNRARVEVGTMAPIDIVEAQAEVARNEEAVIVAETQIQQVEDRLRTLILDPAMQDFWTVRLEPTDTPLLQAKAIDIEPAVRAALDQRTDRHQLEKSIENTETSIRYYANQRLPDINLQIDYRLTGLGGTRLIRAPGFPGPVIGQEERPFGSVLGDVFTNDFPTWTVELSVGYPIGRGAAEAKLARARLERSQAGARIRALELQIAAEMRTIGRQVTMNLKRVDATRAARQLAERRLEAEQKKFGVGMSTSFLIFQAQRDLARALNGGLQAILDYIKSLVDFEAVQEIPLGGGPVSGLGLSGVVTSGGATPTSTSTAAASASAAGGIGQRRMTTYQ